MGLPGPRGLLDTDLGMRTMLPLPEQVCRDQASAASWPSLAHTGSVQPLDWPIALYL